MTYAKSGWLMAAAGILLLANTGALNLLIVLLPAAVVLAFGLSWLGRGRQT